MTEQTTKLQELYSQLEAELPERLKIHLKLEADENKDCINLIIKDMGEMGKENFKQLRSLLEETYDAEFVNTAFPALPYYRVKMKHPVALPSGDAIEQALRDSLVKKAQALNLGVPDANLLTMPLAKLETLVKVASKVTPQEQAKASNDAKPIEAPKQPSPMQLLKARFCDLCEDNASDNCNLDFCLKILGVFEVQSQTDVLEKIHRSLDNVQRQLSQIPHASQPVQAVSSSHADARSPPAAQPPAEKVERNTRPLEGHREGDVVWIYAENQQGERYEKALDKDNARSNGYYDIRGKIQAAEKEGKKGVVIDGKWCWLSKQGDYIGRKTAKEFPTGGRR
jgi:hypothetical protein